MDTRREFLKKTMYAAWLLSTAGRTNTRGIIANAGGINRSFG